MESDPDAVDDHNLLFSDQPLLKLECGVYENLCLLCKGRNKTLMQSVKVVLEALI